MLDLNIRLATQVCVLYIKQQHLRVKSLAFKKWYVKAYSHAFQQHSNGASEKIFDADPADNTQGDNYDVKVVNNVPNFEEKTIDPNSIPLSQSPRLHINSKPSPLLETQMDVSSTSYLRQASAPASLNRSSSLLPMSPFSDRGDEHQVQSQQRQQQLDTTATIDLDLDRKRRSLLQSAKIIMTGGSILRQDHGDGSRLSSNEKTKGGDQQLSTSHVRRNAEEIRENVVEKWQRGRDSEVSKKASSMSPTSPIYSPKVRFSPDEDAYGSNKITIDDLRIIDMIAAQNEKTSRILNNSAPRRHYPQKSYSNPKNLSISTSYSTLPESHEDYLEIEEREVEADDIPCVDMGRMRTSKATPFILSPRKGSIPWHENLRRNTPNRLELYTKSRGPYNPVEKRIHTNNRDSKSSTSKYLVIF